LNAEIFKPHLGFSAKFLDRSSTWMEFLDENCGNFDQMISVKVRRGEERR
jgi:hypothetical protein